MAYRIFSPPLPKLRLEKTKQYSMQDLINLLHEFARENDGRRPTAAEVRQLHRRNPDKWPSYDRFSLKGGLEVLFSQAPTI